MISKFSLAQYSGFALSFLFVSSKVYSQAVYTDIDPDIVLDEDFDALGVDMDNNGGFDFAFIKFSYTTSDSVLDYQKIEKMFCGAYGNSANMIAGTHPFRYYPYAISSGVMIDNELLFYGYGYQRMAYQRFSSFAGHSTVILMHYGGKWYPEKLDHYLGVKFEGEDDCIHFGWIRCSVEDSGRVLTVKDYAFESKCDVGIIAGDVIGDTTVNIEENNSLIASVYSFNKILYIHLTSFATDTEVYLYNQIGQLIFSSEINNQFSEIPLEFANGVYIYEIRESGHRINSGKIAIY